MHRAQQELRETFRTTDDNNLPSQLRKFINAQAQAAPILDELDTKKQKLPPDGSSSH